MELRLKGREDLEDWKGSRKIKRPMKIGLVIHVVIKKFTDGLRQM